MRALAAPFPALTGAQFNPDLGKTSIRRRLVCPETRESKQRWDCVGWKPACEWRMIGAEVA